MISLGKANALDGLDTWLLLVVNVPLPLHYFVFYLSDFLFPALYRCSFLAHTCFSLYPRLAFWLTLAFILCNFGLCCHLLLSLTFVACCSRRSLDYLPFCCPLLTSSFPLLFYLTISCVSSSSFISLTQSFLHVMLFVLSVGLLSSFL